MSDQAQGDLPDFGEFRNWKPEAQAEALELLRQYQAAQWRPFYCEDQLCQGKPHDNWTWNHARADQRPPRWGARWLVWLLSGGRGSGKTRTGAEVTHKISNLTPRIGLIAPTGPDLRDTMVEGVSGILATSPPGKRPLWEPSKKRLTWPNGCIGQGFSAEEPDRLRGPQQGYVWGDEPAHWPLVEEVWSNAILGLRVKETFKGEPWKPKVVLTTTPKPSPWMKELLKDDKTIVTRVSTYENIDNLAETFREAVLERFEGLRMGRQELYGEYLEDVEGSLWKNDMIFKVDEPPCGMTRIVVGVDPAGTANPKSDLTGIITCGVGEDGNYYVFSDLSDRYSPERWARAANGEYARLSADAIVAERNFGEDMVRFTLENSGFKGARIKMVRSRRGKAIRAEPIVALYEKGKVYHVGELTELEDEQTSWVPGQGASPNRVDALVHAMTDLVAHAQPGSFASPNDLRRRLGDRFYGTG